MKPSMNTPIEALQTQISAVVEQHTSFETAAAAEAAQELALVTKVLQLVQPALKALCSRPETGHVFHVGADDCKTQRADWSGFLLRGTDEPTRANPRDNAGHYGGVGWFILPDLTLRRVDYDGVWSRWDGSQNAARSTQHTVDLAELMTWETAEAIVEKIVKALDEQLAGSKTKRTKAILQRTATLHAVLELLSGGAA